jgi:hypothetical protein
MHFNLRPIPPNIFVYFEPELPDFRLRFGIGHPVITTIFILTGNLATIAAVASINIANKNFHSYTPPSTQL